MRVVATYAEAHDMLVSGPKDGQEHKLSYRGKWRVTGPAEDSDLVVMVLKKEEKL